MSKAMQVKETNVSRIRDAIEHPKTMAQISTALGPEKAGLFAASMIDLIMDNKQLQECAPADLVKMAVKAASLGMPISKELGFVWVVPRKVEGSIKPCFQIGYKGYVQLAIASGLVQALNAGTLYEGEKVVVDRITGQVRFEGGSPDLSKPAAFFAHIRLINGFEKTEVWSLERMREHVKKNCNSKSRAWKEDFSAMAEKTVLSHLTRKYAPLSVVASSLKRQDLFEEEDFAEEKPMVVDAKVEQKPAEKKASPKLPPKPKVPADEPPPIDDGDFLDDMPMKPNF